MLGKTVKGRYRIEKKLGEGGMGIVYSARDARSSEKVAIKMMKGDLAADEHAMMRFNREARAIKQLRHEGIIRILDEGTDPAPYIVMEFIDGENIRKYFDRRSGRLSDILDKIGQALRALEHAHSLGILHRDIKPENMMINRDGKLKLMDFGLARRTREASASITRSGTIVGTVAYISPEQALGKRGDERSDLYSLGLILYELVTGRLPFKGDNPIAVLLQRVKEEPTPPGKIARHLAPGVEEYILRMIARDPDERFHSCDEALEALEEITGQHCSARADGRHVVLADQAPHKKTSPRAGERKPEPPLAQIMRHTFEVSLVYAEIGGFSKFMERRATLDVTDFLAQFSARMEECWFGADGKIIDSRGTRIIVAFDNIRNDDQAGRAIISARDMRERFAALRRERGERVEELSLKIGIFTEEVTREFFEDESSRERESLLHGAQRLQKLDSGLRDSILMCERTFTSAGDSFPAKLYKSTYLGGRREPIRVFSLA